MAPVSLTSKEVVALEHLLTFADDSRQLRRAEALLWLDEGESAEEVAQRLHVTRQSVYNWIARFNTSSGLDAQARIADRERSGRPRTALGIIDPLIESVIEKDPRELGYRSTIWTAHLLQHYLCKQHRLSVSTKSISRALTRLEIVWKRPRHRLALRSRFWRQAKGG
jgi:transposase